MKKIINGKLYNTETATQVGAWDNGRSYRDLSYCAETLFRKKTGEYFLYGDGGATTKYAQYIGDNQWGGSSQIIPLAYDTARQWAEEHLPAEEYESEFGAVPEDDSTAFLNISIRADTAERIRRAASAAGKTISDYLVCCFESAQ